MVRCVNRVVVFLSPGKHLCTFFTNLEYIDSPNCCVEFWEAMQAPNKVLVCILKPLNDGIMRYLEEKQVKICFGFDEYFFCASHNASRLLLILHAELEDTQDEISYNWWRNQSIASGGVPENIAPSKKWSFPKFNLWGPLFLPSRPISCGPAFIAGDCTSAGLSFRAPWYFFVAVTAICSSLFDLFFKRFYDTESYSYLDYLWLCSVCCCNLAPFWGIYKLFDTRIFCDASLRPLLASKAIEPGVMVEIIGDDSHPIVENLKKFIAILGHTYIPIDSFSASSPFQFETSGGTQLINKFGLDKNAGSLPRKQSMIRSRELKVQIQVMSSYEHRDALFGPEQVPFDSKRTVFIWTEEADPFQKVKGVPDPIGQKMNRYLCLIASWEKANLAEAVFSAVGVRVVDVLHGIE